jgi:hypothetical protein
MKMSRFKVELTMAGLILAALACVIMISIGERTSRNLDGGKTTWEELDPKPALGQPPAAMATRHGRIQAPGGRAMVLSAKERQDQLLRLRAGSRRRVAPEGPTDPDAPLPQRSSDSPGPTRDDQEGGAMTGAGIAILVVLGLAVCGTIWILMVDGKHREEEYDRAWRQKCRELELQEAEKK